MVDGGRDKGVFVCELLWDSQDDPYLAFYNLFGYKFCFGSTVPFFSASLELPILFQLHLHHSQLFVLVVVKLKNKRSQSINAEICRKIPNFQTKNLKMYVLEGLLWSTYLLVSCAVA